MQICGHRPFAPCWHLPGPHHWWWLVGGCFGGWQNAATTSWGAPGMAQGGWGGPLRAMRSKLRTTQALWSGQPYSKPHFVECARGPQHCTWYAVPVFSRTRRKLCTDYEISPVAGNFVFALFLFDLVCTNQTSGAKVVGILQGFRT